MKRTHTCGELTGKDINKKVTLAGWCSTRRDHGGVIFIDLRDRYGLTQIVFDPSHNIESHRAAEALRREDVIIVEGHVRNRPKGMQNERLATGMIEVLVDKILSTNKAQTPPLEIDDRIEASEEMRLKYRYLDLRRPKMQKQLMFRHQLTIAVREYLDKQGFVEIETPMLIKTTPEGARDYLVPSRIHPRKFYSLPQSPQIYKQILMIAGFDRYYQLARCLRDEDLRADRQPEHTQIDLEMSFADAEDIFHLTEGLVKHVFRKLLNKDVKAPFKKFTYDEAMERFCTDKPDIRFGMECCDVTGIIKESEFKVFLDVVKKDGIVKALNAENCGEKLSRNQIDELIEFAKQNGAQGLAWMKVTKKGLESNIVKFFPEKVQKTLLEKTKAKAGDLLLFAADNPKIVNDVLSKIRLKLGNDLGLIKENDFEFCFITDFPMFEWNEDEQRWDFAHNPFTMPKEAFWDKLEKDAGKVISYQYDFVMNGSELFSGSVRNTIPELQMRTFKVTGMSEEEIKEKFGFLLESYRYGAPMHAGFGLGFDRLAGLMQGIHDIREVIAFPKNKAAENPMDGSPNEASEKQLAELHIKLDFVKEAVNVVFGQIRDILNKEKIEYEVLEHRPVFTSKEAAEVRGTELKQGCKALVLKTEEGHIQAVVPGNKELDIEKLQKLTLFKKLELADAKEVRKVSGCNIGSVPPFGNLFGLKVYFDKLVLENDIVAFNAGQHTKSIKMKAKDLQRVVNPAVGEFSK
ncbi:aspartate--tRNA ligase [Candidatus Woesearchaeota archaeon]|nr:aspartate--tRNA ligase [Candidatus Pacearchaeota archaeon]MBI4451914.1 aspartate--tRNA ligase [Candidatus Woesearchaeota archaeon]